MSKIRIKTNPKTKTKIKKMRRRKDIDKGDVLLPALRVVGRGSGCERTSESESERMSESGCDNY